MTLNISVDEVASLVSAAQDVRTPNFGANVENTSYGAAICAERNALTRAIMEGHRKFRAIAISSDQKDPISPCGICRQFIREFGVDTPIFMTSADGKHVVEKTLTELLPMSFGPENLGF